jgi:hypothetical protein
MLDKQQVVNHTERKFPVIVSGDNKDFLDNTYGKDVWRILADNGFVSGKVVSSVGFCRDIKFNRLLAVFPKSYHSTAARKVLENHVLARKHVYKLIRVFNQINRETNYKINSIEADQKKYNIDNSKDLIFDSLEAALKLRNEFKKNGLYYRRRKSQRENNDSLPINWQRTIKTYSPQLSDGEIYYNKKIHNHRKRDLRHPLTDLHLACLKNILELTGDDELLYSVKDYIPTTQRLAYNNPTKRINDIAYDVYDERGVRIKKLITVYLNTEKAIADSKVLHDEMLSYTCEFENIWEHVLRKLFSSDQNNRSLPAGKWFFYNATDKNKTGIVPSIDAQVERGDFTALIDAKDYRVADSVRNGSSGDHYKQIMYRLLAGPTIGKDFFNILIFPSFGQDTLFKIQGCHEWDIVPNSRVYEVTADYELATSIWLGESSVSADLYVEQLFNELRMFNPSMPAKPQMS